MSVAKNDRGGRVAARDHQDGHLRILDDGDPGGHGIPQAQLFEPELAEATRGMRFRIAHRQWTCPNELDNRKGAIDRDCPGIAAVRAANKHDFIADDLRTASMAYQVALRE